MANTIILQLINFDVEPRQACVFDLKANLTQATAEDLCTWKAAQRTTNQHLNHVLARGDQVRDPQSGVLCHLWLLEFRTFRKVTQL